MLLNFIDNQLFMKIGIFLLLFGSIKLKCAVVPYEV